MRIEHVGLFTRDIERLRSFYVSSFGAVASGKHEDPRFGFSSYFLSFENGTRLEIMQMPSIPETKNDPFAQFTGYVHVAFSTGSREGVTRLTAQLHEEGHRVLEAPHETSDGYFESTVLDPDGNRIEITI